MTSERVSSSLFRHSDLPLEAHRCPALRGCLLCVTGLSGVERKEVQRLCQEHGAQYTGQLKMNECTHLIASEPTGEPSSPLGSSFSAPRSLLCGLGRTVVPVLQSCCVNKKKSSTRLNSFTAVASTLVCISVVC